jgi:phospholipid/cholesterol/gamma-HCH transport system substrate-binding protein
MAKITQGAKVGAFILVAGAAGYVIYRAVSKDIGSGASYTVHAYVDDASGLANHSRVTESGIAVGSIDKIFLENGRARIDIKVNKDVVLFKDARAGKKSASLLGESVIVLSPGTTEPKLKDGDEITSMPPDASIEQIEQNVNDITILVKQVAAQLAGSIGTAQGGQNLRDILDNLAKATEAINQTVRENRSYINDTLRNVDAISSNSRPQIEKILENVRVVTEEAKVLISQTDKNGAGGNVKDTIANLDSASKKLDVALGHMDVVTERLDKGEGTLGRLSKDETLINEVQGVAEGVNDYVGGITRLQTIVGLRSDYNFLANTIKSYVEIRLQPSEDKYYVIELVNDPRGLTNITQTDVDTTNPNDPAHYHTVTTTTTDAFRFSLQFARRIGPFTGRFGIKESTGGLGLDIHLLKDRFEIRNDLFGFGEEIQPRYRVALGYEFVRHLWLLGGVDYVFSDKRDYFMGLQLRFTDQDLKTILPFAGGATSGASK